MKAQNRENDKYNRVDIKVIDANQKIIIIEIQYSREMDYLQRISFASAKTITEHLVIGASYSDVSKVISINILYFDFDFDFGKGDDYIYHGTTNFIGLHNHSELQLSEEQKRLYSSEKIADIYPEYYLIEIRNFNNSAKDTLDEWIYFLKNEQVEDGFTAKGLTQAKAVLDVLKMNDEERLDYEYHQTQLHHEASLYESTYVLGKLEGIEEGIEKGIEKGLLMAAKNLKQAGIDNNTIASATGLPIQQISQL